MKKGERGCHRHKGLRVVAAFGTPTNQCWDTYIGLLPGHYWHTGAHWGRWWRQREFGQSGKLCWWHLYWRLSMFSDWTRRELTLPLGGYLNLFDLPSTLFLYFHVLWMNVPSPCLQQLLQYNWLTRASNRFLRVGSKSCREGREVYSNHHLPTISFRFKYFQALTKNTHFYSNHFRKEKAWLKFGWTFRLSHSLLHSSEAQKCSLKVCSS